MKNIIIISIFVFMVTFTYGQTDVNRFSYSTTIGTGIAMSSPSRTPFSWQAIGYYNLTPRWAIGAGTGVLVYEKALLPLFADAKFRLIKPRKFTPYLECAVGYSFSLAKDATGGFYLSPTVGVEYALNQKVKLLFGIGYESQELNHIKSYQSNNFLTEFQEQIYHSTLTFKIGVIF